LRINLKAKTINDKSANFPVIHCNRGDQPVRETKSHISDCVTAKSHIMHVGTHENHTISSHMNITQAYKST